MTAASSPVDGSQYVASTLEIPASPNLASNQVLGSTFVANSAPATRIPISHGMHSIGIAGATTDIATYYKKRWRDSACLTATYVTMVTQVPSASYTGSLPCGGPLVDECIVVIWQIET